MQYETQKRTPILVKSKATKWRERWLNQRREPKTQDDPVQDVLQLCLAKKFRKSLIWAGKPEPVNLATKATKSLDIRGEKSALSNWATKVMSSWEGKVDVLVLKRSVMKDIKRW